jgi:hypothetical protein
MKKLVASLAVASASITASTEAMAWGCDSNCKWYQADCYLYKETHCYKKTFQMCGRDISVPAWLYGTCVAAVSFMPAECSVAAALTAGSSCMAGIAIATTACGMGTATLTDIARSCMDGDY